MELDPAADLGALQAELERERERTREVDHRAKNSLQMVSSLLLLQSRRTPMPETQRALKAMHQRIGAIAAVHRDVLSSTHPDRFDVAEFVRDHVASLAKSQPDGASIRLDLDPVQVPVSHACALALVVNELVLNALMHGAPANGAAEVTVTLRRSASGFVLKVEDAGPGLPEDAASRGFGLTVARLLAQQIGAKLELEDATPGVRAVITAAV